MKKDLDFVLSLAKYISSACRFPGTKHHKKVSELIEELLKDWKVNYTKQSFKHFLLKPKEGKLETIYGTFRGNPYTNSPSAVIRGEIVDCNYGLPSDLSKINVAGKIALVKEGKKPFYIKERLLKRKGAIGIVTYRDNLNEIYNGVSVSLLPVLSLKFEDIKNIPDTVITLKTKTEGVKVEGKNFLAKFGKGRLKLLLLAHYDTKPFTNGAIDNALSVAVLLYLTYRLKLQERYLKDYQVLIGFTDSEEFGLKGAKNLTNLFKDKDITKTFVISVDTIGWENPAILVKDGEGYNNPFLISLSKHILKKLKIDSYFSFTEGASGRSDHIPFKKLGAKTLFFASNPFPLRHTRLDSFEIINRRNISLWMEFLTYLVFNFIK
jgi:aminopeptidase YwaD